MHQGDIGAPIRFELLDGSTPFDLTNATEVQLWIRHPSGRLLQRSLDILDHAAGTTYYATLPGDLAEWGKYRFQVRALMNDGARVAFATHDEEVERNVFPAPVAILPTPARLVLRVPETSLT